MPAALFLTTFTKSLPRRLSMELKRKVVSGFAWASLEKFSATALQLIVLIVLTYLLTPAENGIVATLTVFTVIAGVIVDSGFSQALIYRQDVTKKDYDSVFYFSIAIAAALYIILLLISPYISRIINKPELSEIIPAISPWVFSSIIFSSLGCVHQTILMKEFRFRTLSAIGLISTFLAGATAIYMAYAGYSYWALVAQPIVLYFTRSVMLWAVTGWWPSAEFSMSSIKRLFEYGSMMFGVGMISQIFHNISLLMIGKIYTMSDLGLYQKTLQLKDNVSLSIKLAINNVTFPALSTLQHDTPKLVEASRKVVKVLSFMIFPVMVGLALVSEELFNVLLNEDWVGGAPYFSVFCLAGIFIPTTNICSNIFKAMGLTKLFFRLEIVKKIVAFGILIYAAYISVMAIVWAYFIWMGFEMVLNMIYAAKVSGYSLKAQLRDVAPYSLITLAMFGAVYATGAGLASAGASYGVILFAKVAAGLISYTGLSAIFKPEAWRETIEIVKNALAKRRG